jgi:hypothetical protein
VKIYILKWGRNQEKQASFARLETLIEHFNENVKHLPKARKNPLLRVRELGATSTRLEPAEVQMLIEAGLMNAEAA